MFINLVIYVIGIVIVFLIRRYSKSGNRTQYMWAIYMTCIVFSAFRISKYLFADRFWLLPALGTIVLSVIALLILKLWIHLTTRSTNSPH